MWGQKWGTMIWGTAKAAPALGFWPTFALGAVLALLAVRLLPRAHPRATATLVFAVALVVPMVARAMIPYSFANGTVADATQVNANFAAVGVRAASFSGNGAGGLLASSSCGPGPTVNAFYGPTASLTVPMGPPGPTWRMSASVSGTVPVVDTIPSNQVVAAWGLCAAAQGSGPVPFTLFPQVIFGTGAGPSQGQMITISAAGSTTSALGNLSFVPGNTYMVGLCGCTNNPTPPSPQLGPGTLNGWVQLSSE